MMQTLTMQEIMQAVRTLAGNVCPRCGDRVTRTVCRNGSRTCGTDWELYAGMVRDYRREQRTRAKEVRP